MRKHEKSTIYSNVCDLEAWLEFTTDSQHKQIVERVIYGLKRLIPDMYKGDSRNAPMVNK